LKIDFTISRGDVSKDPRPSYGSHKIEKTAGAFDWNHI